MGVFENELYSKSISFLERASDLDGNMGSPCRNLRLPAIMAGKSPKIKGGL